MSTRRGLGGRTELSETLQDFLTGAARLVFYLGLLATIVAFGVLAFNYSRLGGGDATLIKDAKANIGILSQVLDGGVVALAIGACVLFWGEEVFSVILLLGAGILFAAPFYLPMVFGESKNDTMGSAAGAIQSGGLILGIFAVLVLVIDVVSRVQNRVRYGVKTDQMKYGKGVKEEPDRQNIILGKCWQLPYCRKFVREKCPIFLAKTTCWKHMVGCMCEESVIRNAMENKPISKDSILSASFIPSNNKLTTAQKRARCHECVIYNEHQRHKYKVSMPIIVVGYLAIYGIFNSALFGLVSSLCLQLNKVVHAGTLGAAGNFTPPPAFVHMLLFVFLVIALTYTMKTVETVIFRLKV